MVYTHLLNVTLIFKHLRSGGCGAAGLMFPSVPGQHHDIDVAMSAWAAS